MKTENDDMLLRWKFNIAPSSNDLSSNNCFIIIATDYGTFSGLVLWDQSSEQYVFHLTNEERTHYHDMMVSEPEYNVIVDVLKEQFNIFVVSGIYTRPHFVHLTHTYQQIH